MEEKADVQEIIKDIQREAKEMKYKEPVTFAEVTENIRKTALFSGAEFYNYNQPIEGNALKKIFKKLIRKLVAFLFKPLIAEMNGYVQKNEIRAMEYLLKIEKQEKELEENQETIQNLEMRLSQLESKNGNNDNA